MTMYDFHSDALKFIFEPNYYLHFYNYEMLLIELIEFYGIHEKSNNNLSNRFKNIEICL